MRSAPLSRVCHRLSAPCTRALPRLLHCAPPVTRRAAAAPAPPCPARFSACCRWPSSAARFAPAAPAARRAMSAATASDRQGSGRQMEPITCLNGSQAQHVDEVLMSSRIGYAEPQLVELAGLCCAQAIEHAYPQRPGKVLVCAGPGNNGADGLTCARHLRLFGYEVVVLYAKEPKKDLYKGLLQQLRAMEVPIVDKMPEGPFSLLVDAIFGFSFDPKDGIREPYKDIIEHLVSLQSSTPVISIDVPSGWDVVRGDVAGTGLKPEMLVSLTAPKGCAKGFRGRTHVLGGRFLSE